MAAQLLDFADYKKAVEKVSAISVETENWFPQAVV